MYAHAEKINFSASIAPVDHTAPCAQARTADQMLFDLELRTAVVMDVHIRALAQEHPTWFSMYEDNAPETASSSDLDEMLKLAPNAFAAGLILGVLRTRLAMASVTGHLF